MSLTLAHAVVEINEIASKFKSSIVIKTDEKMIDAKSMLGLSYSILHSKEFHLEIHGPDEEEAKKEMMIIFWKYNLPIGINE
ncbi:HPr family phosphocarrier protein [Domibacillus sp. DTU_2020_1001157_1_SI_ALB_TIR_016]|uniref:HPr family phosphocarrier protein n=1 Tax=Domibacillus sp. DTU_2020_1001157_1_SI_ALB_TIR_016 TaxID=3077789 RepID=UPI0028E90592|nr:HPr family phosphocarrier protein [Domibacillus sp. DTU_2020_1001157_1_SI_ALB_TIR_016]WNS79220.1 HPr family phosphocarrier protein [Domibacillus sp. DTU_2020_1001157_1_SI_ALB_TIR_016]